MHIEFIESSHTYLVNGIIVPSVTQIMRADSDEVYNGIPPHILEKAAERGTAVHRAIYEYEQLGFYPTDETVKDYLNRYIVVKSISRLQPVRQEFMLCSTSEPRFAGTVDMLATIGDKTILLDVKTSSALHRELWAIQLAGYDQLCRENGIEPQEHYILHLNGKRGKLYQIIPDYAKWEELIESLRTLPTD